jgi:quercetin dioxygenase-like cupin family protein
MNKSRRRVSEPLPADRASALTDLVGVSEGAIVSRVLASAEGGNVTLFSFDRGQGLSEHIAPFDALVQVVDGEVELTIGDAEVTVRTGEVVLMPAGVPHALAAPEPSRMLLTMLRDRFKEGA